MEMTSLRACCLDASVLVKWHVDEEGSEIVRSFIDSEATLYTTPFCFYEALGVLKVKYLYRKELTKEQYLNACFDLGCEFEARLHEMEDIDVCKPPYLLRSIELARRYDLDVSDAFQILSVKEGFFAGGIEGSETVLVTADTKLANTAASEGLRVLNVLKPSNPS
ncbi:MULTISPECIES: type II toxin-antitoxin system VapC family toxin [unclassified Marinobacter]|uniref:type II toxin-antitoxin system VapC family toxin n=1 Tax=unclassified Marinobacter TaxID=83889 RepID=UPI001268DA64|nr:MULTISPECIES: type II toxin-antitoxin system VapC family toxin [unclassified Marinobacter]QFS89032.1 PIN domain protein [Marinobacter sp. THAF197a]QFT52817.1 PIN domain protein [Marinobacter sp. THAF39]